MENRRREIRHDLRTLVLSVMVVAFTVFAGTALSAALFTTNAAAATVAVRTTVTEDYKKAFEVLQLVNKERRAHGRQPLQMDAELLRLAMYRAAESSLNWSHTRPNGKSWTSAYPSGRKTGENLSIGCTKAKSAVKLWMSSGRHRDNLLSRNFNCIGIGVVKSGGIWYWTEVFSEKADIESVSGAAQVTRTSMVTIPVKADRRYLKASFSIKSSLRKGQCAAPVVKWGSGKAKYTLRGTNVTLKSSNPKVIRIVKGRAVAVGVGKARVTMCYGKYKGVSRTVTVRVRR